MRPAHIFVFAALLCASPATADVTARYALGNGAVPGMIVQADDKGHVRVAMGNQVAILLLDGETYFLTADLSGLYAAKQEDLLAVMTEQMRAMIPPDAAAAPPSDTMVYDIVSGGTEIVGGRSGTVWTLRPHGQAADIPFDFVISTDPDLAPIGRAFAAQFGSSSTMMRNMLGSVPDMAAKAQAILAKGAVIRMGRLMRLESVDKAPVPASAFALPGPVLDRAQLRARMGFGPPAAEAPPVQP